MSLIPSEDDPIKDVCSFFNEERQPLKQKQKDPTLSTSRLTRKLVRSLCL